MNATKGRRDHHSGFILRWESTVGTAVGYLMFAEYLRFIRYVSPVSHLILLRVLKGMHIFNSFYDSQNIGSSTQNGLVPVQVLLHH